MSWLQAESHKVDENRSIFANYDLNSRKFHAYSLGNSNYLREGQATLHSDQGVPLKCVFLYRGISGRGNCEAESEKFDVIIGESSQALKNVTN